MPDDKPRNRKTADETPAAEKPVRSPVERALVWGGILLLLAFTAVEGAARLGYSRTLSNLQAVAEADEKGKPMSAAEFRASALSGFATVEEAPRKLTFRWWSLVKNYEIEVTLNDEDPPLVLGFATPYAEDPATQAIAADDSGDADPGSDDEAEEMAGNDGESGDGDGGGPGGANGQGGRGRRGARGLVGVLRNEGVLAELELDDEASTALNELVAGQSPQGGPGAERPTPEERAVSERELEAKVAEQLGPEKFAIVRGHLLRELGLAGLLREDVAMELSLTDDQRTQLSELVERTNTERRALFENAAEGDRDATRTAMQQLNDDSLAEALAILDDTQREKWTEISAQ